MARRRKPCDFCEEVKPLRTEVVRRQKLIIRSKILLSRDELSEMAKRIEYSLENDSVVMIPEEFDAFTVDQDCVLEVYKESELGWMS